MKKRKVTSKKARATALARKKPPVIVRQVTWHLVLAPQDPDGLTEFKGPLPLPGLYESVFVEKNAEVLRQLGMEALIDSPAELEQVVSAVLDDEHNLLTISGSVFSDGSVKTEFTFGAISVGMICPGEPNFSRGLRDLRRMVVKPAKPARAWHVTGQRPPNPRYREHRQRV